MANDSFRLLTHASFDSIEAFHVLLPAYCLLSRRKVAISIRAQHMFGGRSTSRRTALS